MSHMLGQLVGLLRDAQDLLRGNEGGHEFSGTRAQSKGKASAQGSEGACAP